MNTEEFKELYPITSNSVLSKKYKLSESYLRTLAAKLKISKKAGVHNARWKKSQIIYLLKYYKKGKTITEIAEHIGKTRYAVIDKHREIVHSTRISKNVKKV